jgi:hypothetical protein
MPKLLRRALVLGVVLALVAAVGVAAGAIPDSGGTIHGCYTKTGGILRVVDTDRNQHCISARENDISWGQRGPQGDTGPAGTAGQDAQTAFSTGPVADPGTRFTPVPGMKLTVDVPADAVLDVNTDGGVALVAFSDDSYAIVDIALMIDGDLAPGAAVRRLTPHPIGSTAFQNWSLGQSLTLPPGPHTFEVQARVLDANLPLNGVHIGGAGPRRDDATIGRLTVETLRR